MLRVMITGCSRHSKGIADALRNNYDNEEIFVLGVNRDRRFLLMNSVDATELVPSINENGYLEAMLKACKKHSIDVVLPFITMELPVIAEQKEHYENIGVKVSVSSKESLAIVNDKIQLYERFGKYMPEQIVPCSVGDARRFITAFGNGNVCCKLSDKCGGNGFAIIDDEKAKDFTLLNKYSCPRYIDEHLFYDALERNLEAGIPIILQKYIKGLDYSTCALSDNGEPLSICGFVGYEIDFGCVNRGTIMKNEKAYEIHDELIRRNGLDGNSCADFILHGDDVTLLEVNPRLSGSLPFIAEAGANYVYDRCKMLLGKKIDTNYDIRYGLEMGKYYEFEYFV